MPVTKYIWDPVADTYLMETDGADNTTAVYTNEPAQYGNLVSQRRNGSTHYHHYDALGSTRELTDETETVTDTNLYDAWGVDVANSGTTENPFRWVGEVGYYYDPERGQCFVRARIYGPTIVRWTSMDLRPPFPDSANFFAYVLNGPLTSLDPSGLDLIPGLARADNTRSFRYPDQGPGRLGNYRLDYDWTIQQSFGTGNEAQMPPEWNNRRPRQTWQFNRALVTGVVYNAAKMKCEIYRTRAYQAVEDIKRFVGRGRRITDTLSFLGVSDLPPDATVCYWHERVTKVLGFNPIGRTRPVTMAPRPVNPRIFIGMRGPFLYMQTDYYYHESGPPHCCCMLEPALVNVKTPWNPSGQDTIWPVPEPGCAMEFYVLAAAALKSCDFNNPPRLPLKRFGEWEGWCCFDV